MKYLIILQVIIIVLYIYEEIQGVGSVLLAFKFAYNLQRRCSNIKTKQIKKNNLYKICYLA